ncbi:MAG: hypothetical protein Q4C49_10680 [Bacillota bacterium]|nr:hypothetical protein [Bacillota bacterium]
MAVYKYFKYSKYDKYYWDEDGNPLFKKVYGNSSCKVEDDFDIEDYDNPEDFWENHEPDFEDYEEAEEYWEDWHE